jgi:hypothetical protein
MADRTSEIYGVDARKGDNDIYMDFSPKTVLEDNQDAVDRGATTSGGRGSQDTIAAKQLGSQGKKRK